MTNKKCAYSSRICLERKQDLVSGFRPLCLPGQEQRFRNKDAHPLKFNLQNLGLQLEIFKPWMLSHPISVVCPPWFGQVCSNVLCLAAPVGEGWWDSRETSRQLRCTPSAHGGGIAGTVGGTGKCGCKIANIFSFSWSSASCARNTWSFSVKCTIHQPGTFITKRDHMPLWKFSDFSLVAEPSIFCIHGPLSESWR